MSRPILISHRGNIDGPNPERENHPQYIGEALQLGFGAEIDIWVSANGDTHLGHDAPQYKVSMEWLYDRKDRLWVHAKNYYALFRILNSNYIQGFFHTVEKHVIINNTRLAWSHDLEEAGSFSIIPLITKADIAVWKPKPVYGICSDYVTYLKTQPWP